MISRIDKKVALVMQRDFGCGGYFVNAFDIDADTYLGAFANTAQAKAHFDGGQGLVEFELHRWHEPSKYRTAPYTTLEVACG